jgi:hypothetical protein
MLEIKDVEVGIQNAITEKDKDAIWRGLSDLIDAGMEDIVIHIKHITTTGIRIETSITYPEQKLTISSPNKKLSVADKLFLKLKWIADLKRLEQKRQPIYFKHENEMSPEEYKWLLNE